MYRQLPTDLSAQQALLSSLDRRLPSHAQQECEGAKQGITLDELQAALKLSVRGKKPDSDGLPYEFYSLFFFFFFFFWVGELFITPTCTCNERNHKCKTEGHPQPKLQATLATWVKANSKVCKKATFQAKQAAYKAVVHQPTAKPVHFEQTKHHRAAFRQEHTLTPW